MTAAPIKDIHLATERGRRVLHVTLDVDERVAADIQLRRSRRRPARERTVGPGPGRHDVDLPLKRLTRRGPARLTVALADPRGDRRTVQELPVELA